jgi:hypothetical protein
MNALVELRLLFILERLFVMTIRVYPVKIEAVDENDELMFTLETFDEYVAHLNVKVMLGEDNLEEFIGALRKGVTLLELTKGKTSCGDGS